MRLLLPSAVLIAIAVVAIMLLRGALRRVVATERAQAAEQVLPFLIGTIGGYYGLLTGFILSAAWGDVQSAQTSAMTEINALADLERIALTLPPPVGPQLRENVGLYLRAIIDHEIEAVTDGQLSREATVAYGRLWATVAGPSVEVPAWEASLLNRAFDKVSVVGEQRRIRFLVSTQTLPAIVWVILLIGGAIILSGATITSLRYGPPAREILMAVAGMLFVVLFSIYAMDRPFRHGFGPGAHRYELLWESFHGDERPNADRVHSQTP